MTFDDIFIPDFWPFLVPLLLLQVILAAIALVLLVKKDGQYLNYLNKPLWALIIIFINTIGPILFLILERD